ncbi:hypothetical protein [Maribacter sp. 2307ULW6-5]|uniref:hypothetical protein n=1 Tax=Maribacter sp. 2307ULW6-5 TaxID=3386275 RepID=UPI0039BC9FC6
MNKSREKDQQTQEQANKKPAQGYDANIKQADVDALGKKGLAMDTGDDTLLQSRKQRLDFTGKDLDVPTGTAHNATTQPTDEENTLYGQGGDRKQNLEAPQGANANKRNGDSK